MLQAAGATRGTVEVCGWRVGWLGTPHLPRAGAATKRLDFTD